MTLKQDITNLRITALKTGQKDVKDVISLVLASIKQVEVDQRIELDDAGVLTVLTKMVKQRLDSIQQYVSAGRQDLADIEQKEIDIIKQFLPAQASEEEILQVIERAIETIFTNNIVFAINVGPRIATSFFWFFKVFRVMPAGKFYNDLSTLQDTSHLI